MQNQAIIDWILGLNPTSKIEEEVGVIRYQDSTQEGDSLSIEKLQKQSIQISHTIGIIR
jgi:hypothetical protein